jgi:hypothetical protein
MCHQGLDLQTTMILKVLYIAQSKEKDLEQQ